jgi:hypothetical protein
VRPDGGRAAGRDAFQFALAALAAWRVTHLLAYEDGPADIVARLRARLGDGLLGKLADCFDCLSIWVAAAHVPFVTRRRDRAVISWLALSGATCLLERAVGGTPPVQIELIE